MALAAHAREQPLPAHVTVASNGHWTRATRQKVLEAVDSVSLSLDGIASVQNRQRPTVRGRSSFNRVWATVGEMDRGQTPYGIRLTVTADSVGQLEESIDFLCRQSGCPTFQVEPAFDHGRARQGGLAWPRREEFSTAFLAAWEIARKAGRHLYYSGARPWLLTSRFCLAPEKALILCHDGGLSACYEVWSSRHSLAGQFRVGKMGHEGRLQVDHQARREFLAKVAQRRAGCVDCFCYWHCAGDCPSKYFTPQGQGKGRSRERCQLNQELTKELLVRYMAESGGIWQGEQSISPLPLGS